VSISDLIYSPNKDGHRLYMRNGCGMSALTALTHSNELTYPCARVFFREYDKKDYEVDSNTYKRNRLLLTEGPCFDL
jgi:hypothetical protein